MKRSQRIKELGTDPEKWMRAFTHDVYFHSAGHPTAEETERFTMKWFEDAIRAGRNAERALLQRQAGTEN